MLGTKTAARHWIGNGTPSTAPLLALWEIKTGFMPKLKKGMEMAFVDKIIFNAADVTLSGKTGVDGSCEARWNVFMNVLLAGKKMWDTSFIVPAERAYAYSLNEIKIKDEKIETTRSLIEHIGGKGEEVQPIDPRPIETSAKPVLAPETFEPDDCTEKTFETLQQVQEELLRTEAVLQPLAHLSRETRSALSKSFILLSEDRDALTLLKQKLDQWREDDFYEQPQSWSDCSVLRLLTETGWTRTTNTNLEAVTLLVSAMDKLPESLSSLIAKCRPDTLRGLNKLVSSLKERGQAHVSESLPASLQDGGELHWLTVFLCSSDDSLREMFELGIMAGGVLLLALCVTVQGLSVMQE
ncbi:uncharacterized protein [Enoplosus armatus]|uniref:uncharacterized protein n=1 Tax=Enoplosus armatus TaxID=215367 RepID=UPI0039963BD2